PGISLLGADPGCAVQIGMGRLRGVVRRGVSRGRLEGGSGGRGAAVVGRDARAAGAGELGALLDRESAYDGAVLAAHGELDDALVLHLASDLAVGDGPQGADRGAGHRAAG